MRQDIQIKIYINNNIVSNYTTTLDFQKDLTVTQQKDFIKSSIKGVDNLKKEKDVLWYGYTELKDDDIVKLKSGLEYNLYLK